MRSLFVPTISKEELVVTAQRRKRDMGKKAWVPQQAMEYMIVIVEE